MNKLKYVVPTIQITEFAGMDAGDNSAEFVPLVQTMEATGIDMDCLDGIIGNSKE